MPDTTSTTPDAPAASGDTTPNTTTVAYSALDATASVPETPTTDSSPGDDPDGDAATDELARWKRRARDWERRAKRNAELATRYPDLESRTTQLQAQYEEAVSARTGVEAELWRERAARAHGVPEDLLDLLTGSSEAEVDERAQRIAAQLTSPRRPLPDPTQGRGTPPSASPADSFAAYVRGALNK